MYTRSNENKNSKNNIKMYAIKKSLKFCKLCFGNYLEYLNEIRAPSIFSHKKYKKFKN